MCFTRTKFTTKGLIYWLISLVSLTCILAIVPTCRILYKRLDYPRFDLDSYLEDGNLNDILNELDKAPFVDIQITAAQNCDEFGKDYELLFERVWNGVRDYCTATVNSDDKYFAACPEDFMVSGVEPRRLS